MTSWRVRGKHISMHLISILLFFSFTAFALSDFSFESSKSGTLTISHKRVLCEKREQVDPKCENRNVVCEVNCEPDGYCPPCGEALSCEEKVVRVFVCYDYFWFPGTAVKEGYISIKELSPV